jgi:hypothetical protein
VANDDLARDLQRLREQTVQKRSVQMGRIDTLRMKLEEAAETFRRAQLNESKAAASDEDIKAEQKRLNDHLNALPEKPRVLLERVRLLQSEQYATANARSEAVATLQGFRQQHEWAGEELRQAEHVMKGIEQDLADIDQQLKMVRGY